MVSWDGVVAGNGSTGWVGNVPILTRGVFFFLLIFLVAKCVKHVRFGGCGKHVTEHCHCHYRSKHSEGKKACAILKSTEGAN
jgi:hypothetical protein